MKRRQFIAAGLASLGALSGIYTWQIEPFWLEFVKKKMPVRNLPIDLVGKTLVQISDIHVGNRFDWQFLIDSFREAQKLQPDFVVYTGDYVSYENEQQVEQLQAVLKHALIGTLGTFGVLGNHDYGDDWAENGVATAIADTLHHAGIHVLRNEQQSAEGLNFIGIDDYWGTNFQPESVMSAYDEQQASVVLCHNPDVCDLDVWNGYRGWILSGHTHGGQCKPPFLPPPLLPVNNRRYTAGEFNLNDGRTLYINRALGHLWQVRFNVRPEITVFELSQA